MNGTENDGVCGYFGGYELNGAWAEAYAAYCGVQDDVPVVADDAVEATTVGADDGTAVGLEAVAFYALCHGVSYSPVGV